MTSPNAMDTEIEDGELRKSPISKEDSLGSLSLSEEDVMDDLEIKPPQARVHKPRRKNKHSSVNSDHRKKHHHSRSHRDDRHRHHRERKEDGSKERGRRHEHRRENNAREEAARAAMEERMREEDRRREEERRRDEERRREEERLRREEDRKLQREERRLERDLREKLKQRRLKEGASETAEERQERELRRQRLMEAERVKETYRKDMEERRARREQRERSRSRERKQEAEQAEVQAEMERAGLVVVSDESLSPLGESDAATPVGRTGQKPNEERIDDMPRVHSTDEDESSSSRSESDEEETSSSSEPESEPERRPERREPTPPVQQPPPPPAQPIPRPKLPAYLPAIMGCRSVEEFNCLNRIEEGTYGVVYRAMDKRTEEIVALKRLKMEKEKEGFPITSLREINTLLKAQHPNIVCVKEIVVGSNMDKIFIVMDYVEHDLKSLMETMKQKQQAFTPGEVKCLMKQLLAAVAHLHDNWILHRDLKTSNLLLSHKGILRVGDFGLAREYGSPLRHYTPIVVTLWYRAPELLLGIKEYSTPIDMWSVGCIFAELLTMEPLFTGKSEVDQLNRIFKALGTPNEQIWPGYSELPAVKKMTFAEFPVSTIKSKFNNLSENGFGLLNGFLTYSPSKRLTAESGLRHSYFTEVPLPIEPAMFPTWPAKSEPGHRKKAASPKPPSGGRIYKQLEDTDEGFHMGQIDRNRINLGPGFSLKF